MIILRNLIGGELRRIREDKGLTLRAVACAGVVSLGYLSEVERGQKELSSEMLAAVCSGLNVPVSEVLLSVAFEAARHEFELTSIMN